jgi:Bacterial protein of unknown function (DUF922)
MKLSYTILLLCLLQASYGQKILIGSTEGNRPLVWSDFIGKVDEGSSFAAMTYWNINYKMGNVQIKDDELIIGSFEVILSFNNANSWVKKEKMTSSLLQHEQVHFDIGVLCMKSFLEKRKALVLTKKNYNEKLQLLFKDVSKKYQDMGVEYDKETDHSKNLPQQIKWNNFIKEELIK